MHNELNQVVRDEAIRNALSKLESQIARNPDLPPIYRSILKDAFAALDAQPASPAKEVVAWRIFEERGDGQTYWTYVDGAERPHEGGDWEPLCRRDASMPELADIIKNKTAEIEAYIGTPWTYRNASDIEAEACGAPLCAGSDTSKAEASSDAARVAELEAAIKSALSWVETEYRPPVPEAFPGGQMVRIRLHALADLHKTLYGEYAAPSAAPAQPQEPVGLVGKMPGTDGFTMAAFDASKVPVGTKLYTSPIAQPAAQRNALIEQQRELEGDL